MPFVFAIGSIAAEAAVRGSGSLLVNFDASWETAERVLEKPKLYIAVFVLLMRRRLHRASSCCPDRWFR